MKEEKLFVDNIKCNGCATSVKEALQNLSGVNQVKVDVEKGLVEITHKGEVTPSTFNKLLDKMGYPEKGTSTILQKGKSYVSCAIGKVKLKTADFTSES